MVGMNLGTDRLGPVVVLRLPRPLPRPGLAAEARRLEFPEKPEMA